MIDNPGRFDIYPSRYDTFGSREQGHSKNAMNPLMSSETQQERVKLMNQIKQCKEHLYQIFCITNPSFVSLILKMRSHQSLTGKSAFALISSDTRKDFLRYEDLYKPKQVLEPLPSILFSSNTITHRFDPYIKTDYNRSRLKAENLILKKLRICRIHSPMDSLTFSKDFIDTVNTIIENFDAVSNHKMFSRVATDAKGRIFLDEFKNSPIWFEINKNNSIVDWVVSHFEIRILRFYLQREEQVTYSKMAIQLRDIYVDIWKGFTEAKQAELISKSLNTIDNFSQLCFVDNHVDSRSNFAEERFHQLNEKEATFKLILMLNQSRESDRRVVKQNLQIGLRKKVEEKGKAGFIRSSVACNIKDAMHMEHFFMSLLVEQLESFYMETVLKSLEEEETDARKKKKKKKKKSKKAKVAVDTVEAVIEKEEEEVEPVELSSVKNTFLLFDETAPNPILKGLSPSRRHLEEKPLDNQVVNEGKSPKFEGSVPTFGLTNIDESLMTPLLQEYNAAEAQRKYMGYVNPDRDVLTRDLEDPLGPKVSNYDMNDIIIRLDSSSTSQVPPPSSVSKIETSKPEAVTQLPECPNTRKILHHIFPDGSEAFGTPFKILNTKLSVSGYKNISDDTLNALTTVNREKSIKFPTDTPRMNFVIHAKTENDMQHQLLLGSEKLSLIKECNFDSRSPSNSKNRDESPDKFELLAQPVELVGKINEAHPTSEHLERLSSNSQVESNEQLEVCSPPANVTEPAPADPKRKSSTNSPIKRVLQKSTKTPLQRQQNRPKKAQYNLTSNPFNLLAMQEEESPLHVHSNHQSKFSAPLEAVPLSSIISKTSYNRDNTSGYENANQESFSKASRYDSTDQHSKTSDYEYSDRYNDMCQNYKEPRYARDNEEARRASLKTKPMNPKGKKLPTLRKVTKEEFHSTRQQLVRPKPVRFTNTPYKEEVPFTNPPLQKKPYQSKEYQPKDANNKQYAQPLYTSQKTTAKDVQGNGARNVPVLKETISAPMKEAVKETVPRIKKVVKPEPVVQVKSIMHWKDDPVEEIKFGNNSNNDSKGRYPEDKSTDYDKSFLNTANKPANFKGTTFKSYDNSSQPKKVDEPSAPSKTPEVLIKKDSISSATNNEANADSQSKTTARRGLKLNKLNANKIYIPQDLPPEFPSPPFGFNYPETQILPGTGPIIPPFSVNPIPSTSTPFLVPIQIPVAASEKTGTRKRVSGVINGIISENVREIKDDLVLHAAELEDSRKKIKERLEDIVKRSFKNDAIFLKSYGSYETRILTPFSDLDLAISGCEMIDRPNAIQMLEIIHHNLQLCPFVLKSQAILTAAVPVLKFEADASIAFEGFEASATSLTVKIDMIVELCEDFNTPNTAIRTTEYITKCIDFYDSFYSNFLVLKYALNFNDFSSSYKGEFIRRPQRVRLRAGLHRVPGAVLPGEERRVRGAHDRIYQVSRDCLRPNCAGRASLWRIWVGL